MACVKDDMTIEEVTVEEQTSLAGFPRCVILQGRARPTTTVSQAPHTRFFLFGGDVCATTNDTLPTMVSSIGAGWSASVKISRIVGIQLYREVWKKETCYPDPKYIGIKAEE